MEENASQRKKHPNWGGKRPGAGGKVRTFSGAKIAELNKQIEAMAKKKGKTIDEVIMEFIYSDEERTSDRIAAYKVVKEYSSIKVSEGGDADKNLGPQIFLPEKKADVTVINGGKKDAPV